MNINNELQYNNTIKPNMQENISLLPENWILTPLKGKKPFRTNWNIETPIDRKILEKNYLNKGCGIGLRTGDISDGILAVDFDGNDSVEKLWGEIKGNNPDTDTVSFTSNKAKGYHQRLFRIPNEYREQFQNFTKIIKKTTENNPDTGKEEQLEFRYNLSQSVLPPSIHPDTGKQYQWINSPENTEVAKTPQWLLDYLIDSIKPKIRQNKPPIDGSHSKYTKISLVKCLTLNNRHIIEKGVDKGSRNDTGFKLACDLIGTANYLDENGQPYLEDIKLLFNQYGENCSPSLGSHEIETIWNSAKSSDRCPSLSEDYIQNCINSQLPKPNNKVVTHPKFQKINLTELNDKLRDIAENISKKSEINSKLNELSLKAGISQYEIRKQYETIVEEIDREDLKIGLKQELDELMDLEKTSKSIDLMNFLPKKLAEPLLRVKPVLGSTDLALLTVLFPLIGSLVNPNLYATLINNSEFTVRANNLYCAIVGESGEAKSPTMNLFLKALYKIQAKHDIEFKNKEKAWKLDYQKWQALPKDERCEILPPEPPIATEYVLNNYTIEKLIKIQNDQPDKGLLLHHDELSGVLTGLNQYKRNGNDIEVLLSGRDGRSCNVHRKDGTRLTVTSASWSIIGAITTDILISQMKNADDPRGYWARFMFAFIPRTKQIFPDDDIKINLTDLLHDLYLKVNKLSTDFCSEDNGEEIQYKPTDIGLTKEAKDLYKKYFENIENERYKEEIQGIRSYMSKNKGFVGELALIIHIIWEVFTTGNLKNPVSDFAMERAISLSKVYLAQVRLIYSLNNHNDDITPKHKTILDFAKGKDKIKARDVRNSLRIFKKIPNGEIRDIFIELANMGYGVTHGKGSSLTFSLKDDNTDNTNNDNNGGNSPNNPINSNSPQNGINENQNIIKESVINLEEKSLKLIQGNDFNPSSKRHQNPKGNNDKNIQTVENKGLEKNDDKKENLSSSVINLENQKLTETGLENIENKNDDSDDKNQKSVINLENPYNANGLENIENKNDDSPSSQSNPLISNNSGINFQNDDNDDRVNNKNIENQNIIENDNKTNNGFKFIHKNDFSLNELHKKHLEQNNIQTVEKSDLQLIDNDLNNSITNGSTLKLTGLSNNIYDNYNNKEEVENDVVYNPGNKNLITKVNNKIMVSADKLQLFTEKKLNLDLWKPTKKIKPYSELVKCYLDIETTGLNAECDRIISVGLMLHEGDKTETKIITNQDEKKMLDELNEYLKTNKMDILIGHNIHAFDFPFLIERSKRNKINLPFKQDSEKYTTNITSASFYGKPMKVRQCRLKGVDIIDTMILAAIYDKSASVLDNYRLKDVAIALGHRDERRLELDHNQILDYWNDGNLEPINEYLEFDLDDTKALTDYFLPIYHYQSKVVPKLSLQQIVTASPAKKWELIAESFYPKSYINSIEADEKFGYEGALTEAKPCFAKNAFKLDVSSMYPSIMLVYELHSKKDKDANLLRVMDYLMAERLRLKKLYKDTGLSEYDNQQNAMKILINGGYGFFGTGGYQFNDMEIAAKVTAYGRGLMKLMLSKLDELNINVHEVDTDGIICSGGEAGEVCNQVQSILPEGINIGIDWDNTDVYIAKKKSYILYQSNGKIKRVGLFRKRDRSKLENDFTVDFIEFYRNDPVLAEEFYRETREQLINGTYPVDNLKITKKIAISDKTLTKAGIGNHGDKVTFYYGEQKRFHSKNGKLLSSNRKPITDGEYWSEYYVKKLDDLYKGIMEVLNLAIASHS